MIISIVGQEEGYGNMTTWVAKSFSRLGHMVHHVDRNKFFIPEDTQVVIFVDCSEDYSDKIGKVTQPTVFWSMDAHMPGGLERSLNIARKADMVFSSNYEHGVKLLRKFGVESHLLPITYMDSYAQPILYKGAVSTKYDVAMIGHANSNERVQLWELLKDYKSFTGIAETEEDYRGVMHGAKIVVNQPTEPWNNILNNRFFEAMGFGCLLLQKRLDTDLIEKLGFENGKHFIYWTDFDDLREKLDLALKNPKEMNKIVASGNVAVRKYSMDMQVAKMETLILSKFWDRI